MIIALKVLAYVLIAAASFYALTWHHIRYVNKTYTRDWNLSSSLMAMFWPLCVPIYIIVQTCAAFIKFTLSRNGITHIEDDDSDNYR